MSSAGELILMARDFVVLLAPFRHFPVRAMLIAKIAMLIAKIAMLIAKIAMLIKMIVIINKNVNISVGCLVFNIYFNSKKIMINLIKMNAEELLDISQVPQDATSQTQDAQESKRE